jgi:hypothetical protein
MSLPIEQVLCLPTLSRVVRQLRYDTGTRNLPVPGRPFTLKQARIR